MAKRSDIARILAGIRSREQRVTREVVFQRILALADRYQIQFRNVIQAAVKLAQRVSLEKLAAMVQTGNEQAILGALQWEDRAMPALEATLPALQADLARKAAKVAERLLPGDLEYRFDITNPLSVRQALEHSNKLVTEIGEQTREGLRAVIANAIQDGLPPFTAAKAIRESVGLRSDQIATIQRMREEGASERALSRARDRKLRERSELIARTETLYSANEGQRMLWEQGRQAGIIPPSAQREYITTPDERLCAICEPLDGKLYGIQEPIVTELGSVDSPPLHPNCFPGDTFVTPGDRVSATSERWYDGEILIIRTASGKKLSATPNHPILTERGWIPVRLLHEVGHVICDDGIDRPLLGDDDREYMPAAIEKVARAFSDAGEVTTREVPVTAVDFHGDGLNSEIAVVRADGLLWNRVHAARGQHAAQALLARGQVADSLLRECLHHLRRHRNLATARSTVSSLRLVLALNLVHQLPLQAFSFGSTAYGDLPAFEESQAHHIAAHAKLIGELLLRRTDQIARDEIVNIECVSFHGRVYNLDCGGWYTANGIIASNCRCTMSLVTNG